MLKFSVKTEFDGAKILKEVEKNARRELYRIGGFIRKTVRNMIRRSPKPSEPGQPMHTRYGYAKESIGFDVQQNPPAVEVGFTPRFRVGDLLEFGGVGKKNRQYPARPTMAAGYEAVKDKVLEQWKSIS